MSKANRTCKVCGKRYYYCPSCPDDTRPSWYCMFHDENCKNIFQILTDSFLNKIPKYTAKKQLEKCNLSNISSFDPDIQEQIKDILATKKPEATPDKKKEATKPEDLSADMTNGHCE